MPPRPPGARRSRRCTLRPACPPWICISSARVSASPAQRRAAAFNALEQIPARTLPGGDYELFLTAAGNPANVLLVDDAVRSRRGAHVHVHRRARSRPSIASSACWSLQALTQASSTTATCASQLRVINGATDTAPRDFAINSQFSPPLFSAIPFGRTHRHCHGSDRRPNDQRHARRQSGRARARIRRSSAYLERTTTAVRGARRHADARGRQRRRPPHPQRGEDRVHERGDAVHGRRLRDRGPRPRPHWRIPAGGARSTRYDTHLQPFDPGDYDLYLRQNAGTALLSGPTRITLSCRAASTACSRSTAPTRQRPASCCSTTSPSRACTRLRSGPRDLLSFAGHT